MSGQSWVGDVWRCVNNILMCFLYWFVADFQFKPVNLLYIYIYIPLVLSWCRKLFHCKTTATALWFCTLMCMHWCHSICVFGSGMWHYYSLWMDCTDSQTFYVLVAWDKAYSSIATRWPDMQYWLIKNFAFSPTHITGKVSQVVWSIWQYHIFFLEGMVLILGRDGYPGTTGHQHSATRQVPDKPVLTLVAWYSSQILIKSRFFSNIFSNKLPQHFYVRLLV